MLQPGDIFPDTARVTSADRLAIGGCDTVDLVARYGTPLYVYDEASVRTRARAYREALAGAYHGRTRVSYAAKAYCAPWLLSLLAGEGLGLDCVSGGELHAAVAVDFPRERIALHGNDKSDEELALALRETVGRVVIDNLEEVERLAALAAARGTRQRVLLRVGPGVEARTHDHLRTGGRDTKFGLDIVSGAAERGLRAVLARPELDLRGLHAHVGSQITEPDTYRTAIERVFEFAARMRDAAGFELSEVSPGGGFGVRYTPQEPGVDAARIIGQVGAFATEAATRFGFAHALPDLVIEPGRSLIATAGVALYRVGSVKEMPGLPAVVAVDGGMGDNVRPAMYGARYTAVLANRVTSAPESSVAIAGRYCESGDVLIADVRLPLPRAGDLVAVPVAGAYQLSMASNYNMVPRPAAVVVAEGTARLVRRRESYADLLAADAI